MRTKLKPTSLSPYTSWTYHDWLAVASAILRNVHPHFSPGRALVTFEGTRPSIYGPLSDGVEGFARTFLLVGFWLKHRSNGKLALENGTQVDWLDIYQQGLLHGTDPNHPEYWGEISGKHQYMVEAASISIGLYFSRPLIWDSFSQRQKDQIGRWLRHILQFPFEDKNWVLFGVIINAFLKAVGQEFYQDQIDFYLDRYDSYYEAEGWYRDGVGPQFDYYNPWALHFYPHLWDEMDPDKTRPELVAVFQARSRLFLEKFAHYFSSTASHPAFGRSIIYRCALVAAAILGSWKGYSPLPPGLTRRLCSQSLKFFWEHDLFDADGSIPLGWTGKFVPLAEKYSGPASPLWLNKVFAAFLMPENHPFWTAVEEPLPVEKGDYCISHQVPGFLVQGHQATGHIQLINQGSDSYVNAPTDWKTPASDFLYLKFAYSSHLFNDLGPTKHDLVCGNMISLYEEKRGFSHRERIHPLYIAGRVAISYHYPFGESYGQKRDSRIESAIIIKGDHQIRVHWVISPNRPLVYEGGYSLAYDKPPPTITQGDDWISVRTQAAQCCVRSLSGYDAVDTSESVGVNPLGKYSCLPYLKTRQPVLAQAILVCEVIARPGHLDIEAELALVTGCICAGRKVALTFSDGESVTVKLGAVEEGEHKVQWNGRPRLRT
ncbi:MAG: DUF2264 domain-containing protein [Candidatus Neomarinimicrobiota bacterium]